jgi:hypothetical protein
MNQICQTIFICTHSTPTGDLILALEEILNNCANMLGVLNR